MCQTKDRPAIPLTAPVFNLYSNQLRRKLSEYYLKPLPWIDQRRAQREWKWIRSIRRKLEKHRLILRQTDKSGVFHIGRRQEYRQKAKRYYEETQAYEELTENPFESTLSAVVHLLNHLRSTNQIKEKQCKEMRPSRATTRLAYMYFLPKPHKVDKIHTV